MRIAIATCAFVLLAGGDAASDAAKKDMERLEGEFTMVSGTINGQAMPDNSLKDSRRLAKSGITTVTIGGMPFMKAKFTIDPSKKPKTMDYQMLEGFTKGKTQLGIYEFDDDTVKFCFSSPGMARPTDFTANAGSGRTASVWRRVKK